MLVSTRGRYALRVMLELAQHGRDCYTALSSIASEQGISGKYLESIISTLSKGGLVEGVERGAATDSPVRRRTTPWERSCVWQRAPWPR